MIPLVVYLVGCVVMAGLVFHASNGGRDLVGTPGETYGACLLWVAAWPAMVVLLVAALVLRAGGWRSP